MKAARPAAEVCLGVPIRVLGGLLHHARYIESRQLRMEIRRGSFRHGVAPCLRNRFIVHYHHHVVEWQLSQFVLVGIQYVPYRRYPLGHGPGPWSRDRKTL
jgi:hypothetical protein